MSDKGFLALAAERYSVRKFSDKPIEREKLELMLRAAQLAPTACNNQPQRILVITGEEGLERLRRCTTSHFGCKAAMLVCASKSESWVREYDSQSSALVDASIVATHIMLEASELGIGSTWVMHFIPAAVREEFSIPEDIEPVALMVLGYPAEDAQPAPLHTKYRPTEETVVWEQFS